MKILEKIFDDCDLKVTRYERVYGGDINDAYCLYTSSGRYFLKVNDKDKFPLMFEKEASGIDLLRENCVLSIPQVIKAGTSDKHQYLLLEWLEKGTPKKDMWESFGRALAMMHKQPQKYFGLEKNNYIGSLQQFNKNHSNWEMFYSECRLVPLFAQFFDPGGLEQQGIDQVETSCMRLARHFPIEPPALLHGDLWAGNYLILSSGYVAIYDPAVYYGHREMDIGMTKLFGGFDQRFYDGYNEVYPLEKDWEKRLELAQLYPILVHAVLFGGHYTRQAREIIKQFA